MESSPSKPHEFVPCQPLSEPQLRALLSACAGHLYPERDRLLVLLSHAAGLRPSEIAQARRWWAMDDGLVGDWLHVQGRWRRDVPLTGELRGAVLAYFRACPGHVVDPLIMPQRIALDDQGRVRGMRASSVQYWFWKLSVETGVPVMAKSGRQGYIVENGRRLREARANVGDLRGMVGLKRVEHYLEADSTAQRRLAERFDRGLFGGPPGPRRDP
jgi:integrase